MYEQVLFHGEHFRVETLAAFDFLTVKMSIKVRAPIRHIIEQIGRFLKLLYLIT